MRPPALAEDNKYYLYQILVGDTWYSIDPWLPFLPQVRGMIAYRMLDKHGNIVKHSGRR